MKKKIEKEYLEWYPYLELIEKLQDKIDWKKEKFETIIAINRGGNIIGTMLSHGTGIPLTVLNKGGMIYEQGKFLVVDDIADSGSTLGSIDYLAQGANRKFDPMQYANKTYKTATLHYRRESKVMPDFFVEATDKWIVYPYEME